ncbi:lamina-associated polypeptide 2, isoforms beta/gamma-like isoform X2 [Anneissia japonica]|uniref:lamina-associated polypeptide 2, isoforms beta/gamma-like isoform X2 n=1 Tax=Anneissia japonica TaxID=1529436 RepID=UPI00142588F1|nr:lamina-associated polypeptide 2, isoforms beta/gamma-like isoform X2 [Anneissia japonica]
MPGLKVNPAVLPKEELIKELTRNNIPLPSPKSRKDVYVKLYRKYLSTSNNHTKKVKKSEFSSDEDEADGEPIYRKRSIEKRTRGAKTAIGLQNGDDTEDDPRSAQLMKTKLFHGILREVESLNPRELKEELESRDEEVGPLVASTMRVYQRKLARLLTEERKSGRQEYEEIEEEEHYSDSDIEEEEEEEEEEEVVLENIEEAPDTQVQAGGDTGPRQRNIPRKPVQPPSQPKSKPAGLVPIWVQMLVLFGLSFLIFAIWYNMETVNNPAEISKN